MDVIRADETGVTIAKGGAVIDLTWADVRHLEAGERAFRPGDSCVTTPAAAGEKRLGIFTWVR